MTGYNFPVGYNPTYYPTYQQQQQQQSGSIIWVQGEAGAKSYLVAPNSTVQLWDSEAQTIYIKSADASGMPSMKIVDYTIRDIAQQPAGHTDDYATKEDLTALEKRIMEQITKGEKGND